MTKPRTITLEVGFEPRRGSRDALERAYERLLPSAVRRRVPHRPAIVDEDAP